MEWHYTSSGYLDSFKKLIKQKHISFDTKAVSLVSACDSMLCQEEPFPCPWIPRQPFPRTLHSGGDGFSFQHKGKNFKKQALLTLPTVGPSVGRSLLLWCFQGNIFSLLFNPNPVIINFGCTFKSSREP